MPPKVAVVILNWNGVHFLKKFLPSVVATNYANLDIYVADNASTDASIPFLKEYYPQLKIIQNAENYGFTKGYNDALRQVKADYYVLLNSDVEVTPNWVQPIVDLMETDSTIAACQPKLLAHHQKDEFEYAGAAGGWIDRFGYLFCRGRFFEVCERDAGQYNGVAEIFWASGAALFFKANLYHQLGGLDNDFFAHMEEVDLCWRAKRAGYKVMFCSDSVVYHVGGGSLPKSNPHKTYLNFRNNLFLLFKNLTFFQLLTLLPFRLFLDIVAAFKMLADKDTSGFKAVLKAHFHFFKSIPLFLKKRRLTADLVAQNRLPDSSVNLVGRYKGSVVWDYFFKGKKRFGDLDL